MPWTPRTALHRDPDQWRRRGLTPPDELAAVVAARLVGTSDPTYADFFLPAGDLRGPVG